MSAASQPLTSLEVGQRAIVTEIKVPAEHRGRLLEMGLIVGTTVELVRFAPRRAHVGEESGVCKRWHFHPAK